ncbi:acetyltransferase [Adhaeribacter aerolatus]|uniref:Acetyltransferase n=1 Tax=Adhaeribacter aerolatus TaxID=670289 RepID=A0A512B5G0_9BACT|nr:hypothetical protein [Adhaeribacter aerolatus]GEO07202.1 acetyltransferase [Adhaeribacter aerolatus]
MKAYLIRRASEADVPGITDLANKYVYDKLSVADRTGGFLTGRFEQPAIIKMINSANSLVALYHQEIVGFALNSRLPAEDYPPLVQNMIVKLSEITFQHRPLTAYSFFFYGPVLVSKHHRGQGLLSQMFRRTQDQNQQNFQLGLAFIHEQNQHSLNVHTQTLGLEVVGQFTFEDHQYYILVFRVRE